MPFQSEKQRRFLHANHPEIAKRWEKEYATGGISNHFRKRFFKGAQADTAQGHAMSPGTSASGGLRHSGNGGGGGGGGHHPKGPTAAEIAAQKAAAAAAAAAAKKAADIKAHKEWITKTKKDRTKKVKHLKNINKTKNWMWKGDKLGKNFYKNVSFDDALKMEKKWGYNPNYTGKGAINIGKNPNILQKGLGFGKYLTQALASPGSNISGGTPLMRMGIMQPGAFSKGVLNLAGKTLGPASLAASAVLSTPDLIEALTKREDDATKSSLFGIDLTKNVNMANGGILDINESEEIIDDGGNEIELTDYNAAFDEPTGVQSLFQAKEGGTPRRSYFTGAYGVGGTENQGSSSRDTGSDYGQFDRAVSQAANNPPSTKSDSGGDGVYQDQIMKIAEQQKKTKETRETAAEQGWHQFITPRHKTPAPKEKSFLDKLAWGIAIYTGLAPLVGLKVPEVVSVTGNLLSKRGEIEQAVKVYNKMFGTDYSFKEFIDNQAEKMIASAEERKEKMDLYKSLPPGHPERIALETELEIGKKPEHLGDDGGSPDLPQVVPIGEEVQEYESIAPDAGATLASIRSKQALNAQLQAKWAAEQEAHDKLYMVANRGGLANLFRVKKQ